MSTRQKRTHKDTNSIRIITPTAVIKPSETERLLGAQVDQNMKWRKHLLDSENSLVKCLNKRVGALKQICQVSSFKTRKIIADGIFISKLIYLMPAWVGCEEYLVDVLQVCQNKAARLVKKLDRFTPTRVLLRQCGWLSVKQLMVYHSLVLLRKIFQNHKPEYLYQKITAGAPQRNTRQSLAVARTLAAAGVLSQPTSPELDKIKLVLVSSSLAQSNSTITTFREKWKNFQNQTQILGVPKCRKCTRSGLSVIF